MQYLFRAFFVAAGMTVVASLVALAQYSGATTPLTGWGILPRHAEGLPGVLTWVFVHGSQEHLVANVPPLFALTMLLFYFYRRVAPLAYVLMWLGSGLLVWGFAPDTNTWHIGSSGLIYSLAAFVVGSGLFRRNMPSLALGLLIVVYYSGLFWALLRREEGISWEGHFYGAVSGLIAAFIFRNVYEPGLQPVIQSRLAVAEEPKRYFLPQDTFEKTRWQRWEEQLKQAEERSIQLPTDPNYSPPGGGAG